MLKSLYLILAILGTLIPYSQFIPFIQEYGLDLQHFIHQLFINSVSSLFAWDFIFTTLTFWVFLFVEGSRLQIKNLWIYLLANLTVGISLALPLFLLVRQQKLESDLLQQF